MSRKIISKNAQFLHETIGSGLEVQKAPSPDSYLTKLIKYIPSEVVALYMTLIGIADASDARDNQKLYWALLAVCALAGGAYLWKMVGKDAKLQIALSVFAFLVWALAIGGPLKFYPDSKVWMALILPVVTFALPLIDP